jgi:hypothetical protein
MAGDRLYDRQDINIELLIKERDEYQREAAASNAELFSVLKKQEYRSADELALVWQLDVIFFWSLYRCLQLIFWVWFCRMQWRGCS